jgi:hydroxymethylpyrimidine/phosphomethylpyrimidine kinase
MTTYPVHMPPPIVLSFAASDPSGGAGLQADLMTVSALGCHALSVTTALTVQDSLGVASILAIDADWVEDQARTLLEDMPVAAFKIGLLGSAENILSSPKSSPITRCAGGPRPGTGLRARRRTGR